MAVLFLVVGLPGAGKTTRARELAATHRALRLTPDTWMIPLFGGSDAGGKRDVLEGRLVATALDALRVGTSVVLDFGFWGRDERAALHWLARSLGARCETVYLPVDRETQRQRIRRRWEQTPHETYPISDDELDRWRARFEPPDEAELAGDLAEQPPPPWSSWPGWAAVRWPTSLD
ncbi:ATP-binding protein [Desertihabitans brevis]|uniref:ATP-binding protein n=1 Tax=Desertihabitans brevis TaxID=2268447 RepID=A0A367YTT1_9ACTN|nr:ATP-binding protein [Desertihabitans brevis]RCK69167.1 ATP-binding protein [Desertihabitans brevis]